MVLTWDSKLNLTKCQSTESTPALQLYSNQVRIPDSANCKLLLTMGLTHYEPGNLNRYRYMVNSRLCGIETVEIGL